MTKEQKEAIDNLEKLSEYGLCYKITEKIQEAIETVLSMLKENSAEIEKKNTELAEKNAEIEKLKADNKNDWKLNANMSKRHLTDIFKIKKKDKIIDLMAEEINETDRGYIDYCQFKMVCDRNCKECIKQYFERKSENGN